MRSSRITHLSIPIIVAALLLASCGSSSDTQASPTEPPTTSPAIAAETTPAPALTTADLVLSAKGIGPLMFGDATDSTIAALSSALGAPTGDTLTEYPTPCSSNPDDCSGYNDGYTADGTVSFGYPVSRSACFGNGLCAIFGGSTADDPTFVGWSLNTNTQELFTADGLTVGSVWADFEDVMTVTGGCYVTAYGETSGVQLQLSATTGELFAPTGFETDSTEEFVQPGPEVMVVDSLSAGEQERTLIGDCPG